MKFLSKLFALFQSHEEKKFLARVDQSHKSLTVSENGAVNIDPAEVRSDPTFREYLARARDLVD